MPRPISTNQIIAALQTLNLRTRFEQLMQTAAQTRELSATQVLLKAFKVEAEAQFRALALECHPDRGGDETRMQEINAAWDIVKIIRVQPRPRPQPQVTFIRMHINYNGTGTTSTTTNTATGGGWVRTDEY